MRTLAIRTPKIQLTRDETGNAPIIIALPNEYASEVLSRVRAVGGLANVAIAYAEYFEIMTIRPDGRAEGELIISQDLSMGMLILRIKKNPGKLVRLRIRDEEVDVPAPSMEFDYAPSSAH
jgi:hypothetical protein